MYVPSLSFLVLLNEWIILTHENDMYICQFATSLYIALHMHAFVCCHVPCHIVCIRLSQSRALTS